MQINKRFNIPPGTMTIKQKSKLITKNIPDRIQIKTSYILYLFIILMILACRLRISIDSDFNLSLSARDS